MIPQLIACCILLLPQPPAPPPETLIRLTVSPAASPKPALRYALLPELHEMHSGNPIPGYLKCFLDQDFSSPMEVLGPSALKQADRAARMDKPDWGILQKAKEDGIQLLLPDVQKVRAIATALQGRFRDEISQKRFDDALVTAKTIFAIARHMEEHPTLIGCLVGIAIAQVAIQPLEELLEQPGCPNLYWALTQLPQPFLSLRTGFQGERLLIGSELRDLDEVEPMTAAKIKKVIDHIEMVRRFEPDRLRDTTRAYVNKRARDAKYVEAARKRLAEGGITDDRLAAFPPEQVVLLDEKREYQTQRDEVMKFMNLPTWEVERLVPKIKDPPEPTLLSFLLPANQKVRRAQGRLEQRFSLLRHVEAIRMYAAENGGKLPASLADVSVPLPVDPFTGKAFRYEVTGATAHLRGTPPKGEEQNTAYNLHYEITIRK